jgi:hypothetical protein
MGSKWPNGIPKRGPSSVGSGRSCKSISPRSEHSS